MLMCSAICSSEAMTKRCDDLAGKPLDDDLAKIMVVVDLGVNKTQVRVELAKRDIIRKDARESTACCVERRCDSLVNGLAPWTWESTKTSLPTNAEDVHYWGGLRAWTSKEGSLRKPMRGMILRLEFPSLPCSWGHGTYYGGKRSVMSCGAGCLGLKDNKDHKKGAWKGMGNCRSRGHFP